MECELEIHNGLLVGLHSECHREEGLLGCMLQLLAKYDGITGLTHFVEDLEVLEIECYECQSFLVAKLLEHEFELLHSNTETICAGFYGFLRLLIILDLGVHVDIRPIIEGFILEYVDILVGESTEEANIYVFYED